MAVRAIEEQLLASGLEFALRRYDAPPATREQLCRAHAASYVEQIFSAAPTEGIVWLDQSTSMVPHILKAALRAAGAVVFGVDLAMSGQTRAAYCNVRPPGHYAEHDHAMGYCIFNNVAVGAAHTLHAHALERVAIVDFDAHHGNGTESIFAPCGPWRDRTRSRIRALLAGLFIRRRP